MVVSHDRDLLVATSNKVWHIVDGMLVEYREPEV